jgi:hypothetical protein
MLLSKLCMFGTWLRHAHTHLHARAHTHTEHAHTHTEHTHTLNTHTHAGHQREGARHHHQGHVTARLSNPHGGHQQHYQRSDGNRRGQVRLTGVWCRFTVCIPRRLHTYSCLSLAPPTGGTNSTINDLFLRSFLKGL